MRLFGSERVMNMMDSLGVDEDTALDQKMLTNAIEQAQKTVESRNFQVRKSTLEYDDVINVQRNLIYEQRRKVLDGEDIHESVAGMVRESIAAAAGTEYPSSPEELETRLAPLEQSFLKKGAVAYESGGSPEKLRQALEEAAFEVYRAREREFGLMPNGQPLMRELERVIMLRVVDEYWMEHIDAMSELRKGIGLRGYGNVKPVDAYKQEGFDMFEEMIGGIRSEVVRRIFTVRVRKEAPIERKSVSKTNVNNVGGDDTAKKQPVRKARKPGRNDPCPCGKWKEDGSRPLKYKECCGRYE